MRKFSSSAPSAALLRLAGEWAGEGGDAASLDDAPLRAATPSSSSDGCSLPSSSCPEEISWPPAAGGADCHAAVNLMTMSAKQAVPARLGSSSLPSLPIAAASGAASPCSASLSLGASQPLPPLDPEQYNHDSLLALAAKYDGPATNQHKVRLPAVWLPANPAAPCCNPQQGLVVASPFSCGPPPAPYPGAACCQGAGGFLLSVALATACRHTRTHTQTKPTPPPLFPILQVVPVDMEQLSACLPPAKVLELVRLNQALELAVHEAHAANAAVAAVAQVRAQPAAAGRACCKAWYCCRLRCRDKGRFHESTCYT